MADPPADSGGRSGSESDRIRILPEVLANKIAAGEVVQRPASVVKELVENALDADARNVEIVVRDGGGAYIEVIDDGCGMSPRDAVACFRRHATSKISDIDDLDAVATLGFRGEALASIGSVARVDIKTRRDGDPTGTHVIVEGGGAPEVSPCASPVGTAVAVRNLFYNVPARRKFLKTRATEYRHVVEVVQLAALARPGTAFRLKNGDQVVIDVRPEEGDDAKALRDRIAALFPDRAAELVPVGEATSYLTVLGFVSVGPRFGASRRAQMLIVNGRPVMSAYLSHAVRAAYGDLLPEGRYPFFVLRLDLDPGHLDVNVHPTKAEVKFDDERAVYALLKAVVRKGIGVHERRADPEAGAARPIRLDSGGQGDGWQATRPPSDADMLLYRPVAGPAVVSDAATSDDLAPESGLEPAPGAPMLDETAEQTPVWQLARRYVVTRVRSGLLVVDQHAAHERILYERSLDALGEGMGLSQQLLFPRTVEFSADDFAAVEEIMPDLRMLGFDLEHFGGHAVIVRGVPAGVNESIADALLEQVVDQFRAFQQELRLERIEALARSMARRSAVASGQPLSEGEMRALLDQLFLCREPGISPSGRATIMKLDLSEIERRLR